MATFPSNQVVTATADLIVGSISAIPLPGFGLFGAAFDFIRGISQKDPIAELGKALVQYVDDQIHEAAKEDLKSFIEGVNNELDDYKDRKPADILTANLRDLNEASAKLDSILSRFNADIRPNLDDSDVSYMDLIEILPVIMLFESMCISESRLYKLNLDRGKRTLAAYSTYQSLLKDKFENGKKEWAGKVGDVITTLIPNEGFFWGFEDYELGKFIRLEKVEFSFMDSWNNFWGGNFTNPQKDRAEKAREDYINNKIPQMINEKKQTAEDILSKFIDISRTTTYRIKVKTIGKNPNSNSVNVMLSIGGSLSLSGIQISLSDKCRTNTELEFTYKLSDVETPRMARMEQKNRKSKWGLGKTLALNPQWAGIIEVEKLTPGEDRMVLTRFRIAANPIIQIQGYTPKNFEFEQVSIA